MRKPLPPHLDTLADLVRWLRGQRVPAAIIGGVAVAMLGRPRVTRDVDVLALLEEERWEGFLRAGGRFGLEPRLNDALEFARRQRVLLLRHVPSEIDVDLTFGSLPFEKEAVKRARILRVRRLRLPVVTPEDLIIMKAVARRDRDRQDIQSILETHPSLDLKRVRRWVRAFAEAVESPEMLRDVEVLLAQRSRVRR